MELFFTCRFGAEKTRDELRKQVYDAMAEEEKTAASKLKSEDGKGSTEEKKENGVSECPVKHDEAGSEEPLCSPVSGKEKSSVQETKVNGAGESPTPGKEAVLKGGDSKEQNGGKTGAKAEEGKEEESKPEAEQDEKEPEGSKSLDGEHGLCGWVEHTLGISCYKRGHINGCYKMWRESHQSKSTLHFRGNILLFLLAHLPSVSPSVTL